MIKGIKGARVELKCYADDGHILVQSKRAGERGMASGTRLVGDSLRLTGKR